MEFSTASSAFIAGVIIFSCGYLSISFFLAVASNLESNKTIILRWFWALSQEILFQSKFQSFKVSRKHLPFWWNAMSLFTFNLQDIEPFLSLVNHYKDHHITSLVNKNLCEQWQQQEQLHNFFPVRRTTHSYSTTTE